MVAKTKNYLFCIKINLRNYKVIEESYKRVERIWTSLDDLNQLHEIPMEGWYTSMCMPSWISLCIDALPLSPQWWQKCPLNF